MTAASPHNLPGKNRTLLQLAAYVAIIVIAAYAVITSIGLVGASLEGVLTIGPQPEAELRRPNVPLPPVILPPAGPVRDPQFARRSRSESSFVTLGPAPPDTAVVSSPPGGASGSILSLAAPGQQVPVSSDLTTDVLANPLVAPALPGR